MISQIYDDFPHCKEALQYCLDIISGEISSCSSVWNACKRHLKDLKRPDFKYTFDLEKAEKACNFIELLPHTKGRWAGKKQKLKLQPWQKFLVTSIFGWVDQPGSPTEEYPDGYPGGYRRFRKVYFTVARKNGKSIIAAAIGLYIFCESGDDFAPEVFSGATNEKQAMEVFKPARLMCKKEPGLVEHYDIEVNAKNLANPETGAKFEPVVGDPGDGASPSCWIVDEFHEHKTRDQVDTAESGMGAREEPLLLIITTAGFDVASPCYEEYADCKKMIAGSTPMDETVFALIYELDSDTDDFRDSSVWKKANPNLGVSVNTRYIEAAVADAVRNPSAENKVKTKNFNMWVNARAAWLTSTAWNACADYDLDERDFIERSDRCIGAVDLSSRLDITALARVYTRVIDGLLHYYAFVDHFLPTDTIQDPKQNHSYIKWFHDGDLESAGTSEIDYDVVKERVRGFLDLGGIEEITYDPWKCSQLAQELEKEGAIMVEYRQQVKEMTQAMKELEGAIASGRFHHNGCPVLTWEASNVTNKEDAKGNYYPVKESKAAKIDGMIAVIMGVGRAMYDPESGSVYDTDEVKVL